MATFQKVLRWLDENAEKPVIVIACVAACLLIPYQVFARYFLGSWFKMNVDTSAVEELALFSLIWGTYFAVPLVIKRRENIRMTAFIDWLVPKKYHNFVLLFNNVATFALTSIIVFLAVRLIRLQFQFPQETPTLRIPYYLPYSILFFGFLAQSIRVIQDSVKLVRETGVLQLVLAIFLAVALSAPMVFIEHSPTFVLLLTLFGGMVLGIPIAVVLGIAGAFAIHASGFLQMNIIAQTAYNSLDSFPMLAVFFFVLAGIFMGKGGLSGQLIGLADMMLGRRTGGLAMATVVACTFFGAISGSGIATCAAIGMITIPAMVERGYSKAFSAAIVACSSAIGVMIPPSNPFVLYGVITNVSIGKLFVGGILPGLITAGMLMGVAWYISKKNGWKGEDKEYSWGEIGKALWDARWALMVPVIILGGIYGGIMTPTEAAGVAALYGFLVGMFVLKGITLKNMIEVLVDSSVTAATVLFLVAMASVFGYVMAIEQIPDLISEWMLTLTSNKIAMLLIVNLLLLVVGALMESASATLILAPILMPMMIKLGVDPVHFGVIMVCNLAIGFITPPIGQSLFVAAAISDERTERIALAAVPLLLSMLVMLLIVTYVPAVSLILTRFM
ncbi:TRAP transporter large permease subunit [Mailhella massiliensis]|uniref:TRAP transporter large permease subunit n=1 Tax=Mailhella massiliensis TaxID=1903261 RepID=A0A921AXZ8_9BACT|nr:TRAP transporter large permease subunit [Mailhella massiliensis]HJD98126.1 TRAP transporter large permease subunit [Mailhella massiliensis]